MRVITFNLINVLVLVTKYTLTLLLSKSKYSIKVQFFLYYGISFVEAGFSYIQNQGTHKTRFKRYLKYSPIMWQCIRDQFSNSNMGI